MGLLAIWADRGRDLVPHLTEQTTSLRGFQILVEAFRLWELYEPTHPEHAGRVDDFFLLVEQAFARTIVQREGDWPLPGARRARARRADAPCISIVEPSWHLLGGQKANGLWGLYRGAASRAGLLSDDLMRLSTATFAESTAHTAWTPRAQQSFCTLAKQALDADMPVIPLPTHGNHAVVKALAGTWTRVPLAAHLHDRLVASYPLNAALAALLLDAEGLNHRAVLTQARTQLPIHATVLQDVVRCENLLSVLESIFLWLCAQKGQRLEMVAPTLDVDLGALEAARIAFGSSGHYRSRAASTRQERIVEELDTSGHLALTRSVLELHRKVSKDRGRAAWVWEDQGLVRSELDAAAPEATELLPGIGWRNDYYLAPLQSIALQLRELGHPTPDLSAPQAVSP